MQYAVLHRIKNPTGDIQPVEVPVHFVVQADGEDEEE